MGWRSSGITPDSKNIAQTLNLYIFSVNDEGFVKQWTPSKFGERYEDYEFMENAQELNVAGEQ